MSYRILVVDDSEIIRSVLRKAIHMSGVAVSEILEAGNGAEALEVLGKQWIDLVLADINMPGMNGVDLVRAMRGSELYRSIPILIVSSDRSQPRLEELKRQGIQGFLKKPFHPEEIRDLLLQVLA